MRNKALRSTALFTYSHVRPTNVRLFTSTCGKGVNTSVAEYGGGSGQSIVWAARSEQNPVVQKNQGFFTSGYAGNDSPHGQPGPSSSTERTSDHEYEVRVGRAYDLLRATLPDFMRIGLVDYDHQTNSDDDRNSTTLTRMTLLDVLAFRSLRDRAPEHDVESDKAWSSSSSSSTPSSTDEQTYHQRIHFRFCAHASSTHNLTDEEAASLSFSGRSLYFASAQILRHTINILFADSNVMIESIRRERKSGGVSSSSKGSEAGKEEAYMRNTTPMSGMRNDTIYVRVGFVGHLRVTGAEHRYTLVFRYDIDEDSGKIICHTVERIEPEIGRKLWSGLAAVWSRITGHSSPQPIATAVPVTLPTQRPSNSKSKAM